MYSSTGRDGVSYNDVPKKRRELIWMNRPIIPKYRNGTTSIKRPALNQRAISHPSTGDLGRINLVPLWISAWDWQEQKYVPSIALLVAL
jgi:hypothetical protein